MARPLRMEVPGGRFHITARGNERKIIFRDDRDRVHFLSLLGELTGRYGPLLHGYMERSLSREQIVQAVERGKGERWEQHDGGQSAQPLGQRLRREKEFAVWMEQLKKEIPNVKFEI